MLLLFFKCIDLRIFGFVNLFLHLMTFQEQYKCASIRVFRIFNFQFLKG